MTLLVHYKLRPSLYTSPSFMLQPPFIFPFYPSHLSRNSIEINPMSTVVYQAGLPSCLEPQVSLSRTLRLKLANISNSFFDTSNTSPNNGPWTFIQSLSTASSSSSCNIPKQFHVEREISNYVHPLVKRTPPTLSDMSLELCTENLGSETGTDDVSDTCIFSPSPCKIRSPLQTKLGTKKASAARSFPPPLTTMRGSDHSLRFRPHREDGRLVIKAIKTPLKESLFQAERNDGWLRLSFVKDDIETSLEENEGEIENEEGMDGNNNVEVGGSMGMKKYQMMPSRCKEEPFLVATSKTISTCS